MSEVRSSGRERKPTSKPGAATDDDIADTLAKKPKAATAIPAAADAPQRASLALIALGSAPSWALRTIFFAVLFGLLLPDLDECPPESVEPEP